MTTIETKIKRLCESAVDYASDGDVTDEHSDALYEASQLARSLNEALEFASSIDAEEQIRILVAAAVARAEECAAACEQDRPCSCDRRSGAHIVGPFCATCRESA